jgi:hypothetical protein
MDGTVLLETVVRFGERKDVRTSVEDNGLLGIFLSTSLLLLFTITFRRKSSDRRIHPDLSTRIYLVYQTQWLVEQGRKKKDKGTEEKKKFHVECIIRRILSILSYDLYFV